MIEYFEDAIEIDPQEEFPASILESGLYVRSTGDKLVDKWQEKAALGEEIDFDEAFTTDETKAAFAKIKEKSRAKFKSRYPSQPTEEVTHAEPDEIHDDYTDGR